MLLDRIKPLAEAGKGAKVAQALHSLAGRLISASADESDKVVKATGDKGASLIGKLSEFKLKLGKPKAA